MEIGSDYLKLANLSALATAQPVEKALDHRPALAALKAVEESNLFGNDRHLRYTQDLKNKREILQVIDKETGKVILQVPAAWLLELVESLQDNH